MSVHKEKWRDARWLLMYAVTLSEDTLFEGLMVKSVQFRWWTVPTKSFPSLFEVLGTLQIIDHSGSWIRMMSKCVWVLRMVLTMRWFFYMFWKRTLRFFKIIFSVYRSLRSRLIWICCHEFRHVSWGTILCWSSASRMGIDSNQLGGLPNSWSIWKNGNTVHSSLFQDVVGSVFCSPCSTIQIRSSSQICEVHCIWCISTLGFCMRRLRDPISSSSCTGTHPDSC